ncbi:MAG: M4 family metallopeptidase [Chitinophagales bacterium]|nr:M4 family metallopeptidase [Chitinophagales bacterium]
MKKVIALLIICCVTNALFSGSLTNDQGYLIYKTFDATEAQRMSGLSGNDILRQILPLKLEDSYKLQTAKADAYGKIHERYQQYYGYFPVEFGVYTIHYQDGKAKSANGEYFVIDENSPNVPVLDVFTAVQKAKSFIGAQQYMWEDEEMENLLQIETGNPSASYFPEAKLVYVKDFFGGKNTARLAFKLDIYAKEPVSRGDVYVDAETGAILFVNKTIHHADEVGTAETRYNGTRDITTFNNGTLFQLKENGSRKCETYNLKTGSNYATAKLFTDANNQWTATEYDNAKKDNAALDAHFGAEMTWDYWKNIHSRNSFDGNGAIIKSYVHYGVAYDNAFWDGERMTYGDGSGDFFDALTSLDVCAHEIGHGVCTHTANLIYAGESGGLNEGYSDIWAACVEHFSGGRTKDQIWKIGEDIERREGHVSLRVMSDPKVEGNPDTYLGEFWYDEVHNTSGIFNYWFYLLSEGGIGVNDNGNSYNVAGITIEKAEQIAFRAESVYMTPSTDFVTARAITLQCAEDLYGANSPERKSVDDAWYAVGIGEPCVVEGTDSWQFKILSIGNNTATFTIENNNINSDVEYIVNYIESDSLFSGAFKRVTLFSGDTFRVEGLKKCTRYTITLGLLCESGMKVQTNLTAELKTIGCVCSQITGLYVSYVNYFDATLLFDNYEQADSFEVNYRPVGTLEWESQRIYNYSGIFSEYINLSGLYPGTRYEAKVSALCNNIWQPFTDVVEFTTLEATCGVTTNLTLGSGTQISQDIYGNSEIGNVAQRIKYRSVNVAVLKEIFYPYNTSYFSLYDLAPGTTYMAYVESQCYDSTWNVSDTIYFTTKEMLCTSYNNVYVEEDIKPTEASLWWWGIHVSNITEYQLEYTNYSTGNSVSVNTGLDTSYTLTNLEPNTFYSAKVRAKCGGSWKRWSYSIYFTTPITSGNHQPSTDILPLIISPNPTSGKVKIIAQQTMPDQLFSIVDITGKVVYEQHLSIEKNTPVELDLDNLSKGTYILHTNFEGNNVNQKLVLIK